MRVVVAMIAGVKALLADAAGMSHFLIFAVTMPPL